MPNPYDIQRQLIFKTKFLYYANHLFKRLPYNFYKNYNQIFKASLYSISTEEIGQLYLSSKYAITIDIIPIEENIINYSDFVSSLMDLKIQMTEIIQNNEKKSQSEKSAMITSAAKSTIKKINQVIYSSSTKGNLKIILSLLSNNDIEMQHIINQFDNEYNNRSRRALPIFPIALKAGFALVRPLIIKAMKHLATKGLKHLATSPLVKNQVRTALKSGAKKLFTNFARKTIKTSKSINQKQSKKNILNRGIKKSAYQTSKILATNSLKYLTKIGIKNTLLQSKSDQLKQNTTHTKINQNTSVLNKINGITKDIKETSKFFDDLFLHLKKKIYNIQKKTVNTDVISTKNYNNAVLTVLDKSSVLSNSSTYLSNDQLRQISSPNLDLMTINNLTYMVISIKIPIVDNFGTIDLYQIRKIPYYNQFNIPHEIIIKNTIIGFIQNSNNIMFFPTIKNLKKITKNKYIFSDPLAIYNIMTNTTNSCEISILFKPENILTTCEVNKNIKLTNPQFLQKNVSTFYYVTPYSITFEYKNLENLHCAKDMTSITLPALSNGMFTIPLGTYIENEMLKIENFKSEKNIDLTCEHVIIQNLPTTDITLPLTILMTCISFVLFACIICFYVYMKYKS